MRDIIGDHAADEALHSVYFHNLFPVLWHNISASNKEEIGKLLPQLVWAFLEPDNHVEYRILRQLGFNTEDPKGILAEVYVPRQVAQGVKQAASPTLKMFNSAGVFSIPTVEQAFTDDQLI